MKKILLAATVLAGSFAAAHAADLPARKAPPVVVAPAPVFTWSGFYLGANLGYGWMESFNGNGNVLDAWNGFAWVPGVGVVGTNPHGGVTGGLQAGYNWQVSPMFLVGVETDLQGSSVGGGYVARNLPLFGTVRGRLGFIATPSLLIYGTGGFAYGSMSIGPMWDGFKPSAFATGWTLGGGLEYAFAPNWSAKLEYLYMNVGASNWGGLNPRSERIHQQNIRLGVNYHFNLGAPGPVVAKY